jgi:hypothetical protein
VGVLCIVVAVAVAPGSVVAVSVGSSAPVVLVGSVFVRELAAWRVDDAAEVTAQYAPPPPTIAIPSSARVIRLLKSLPRRLMDSLPPLSVDG